MAYNRNFGIGYQPPYSSYYPYNSYNSYGFPQNSPIPGQQNQQPINGQQQQQNQAQAHTGGFVRVQSEDEARRYPVAPGNSVTFIDENAPYCYTKSVDFSQLDRPIFKRFRLVEETGENPIESREKSSTDTKQQVNFDDFVKIEDLEKVKSDCRSLKSTVEKLKEELDSISTQTVKSNSKSKKESDKE